MAFVFLVLKDRAFFTLAFLNLYKRATWSWMGCELWRVAIEIVRLPSRTTPISIDSTLTSVCVFCAKAIAPKRRTISKVKIDFMSVRLGYLKITPITGWDVL